MQTYLYISSARKVIVKLIYNSEANQERLIKQAKINLFYLKCVLSFLCLDEDLERQKALLRNSASSF